MVELVARKTKTEHAAEVKVAELGKISIVVVRLEFFTNSHKYKNVNIANLVLAVPLKRNWTNEVCSIEM